MPATILSSNLITIPVLDALLSSTTSPPNPVKRVQLLSTKLAILTNRPSQPARGQPFDVELQILRTRLDLASAHLALADGKGVGELKLAESELNLVERECKGIIKRYSRLVKQEKDKAQARARAGALEEGGEGGDGDGDRSPDISDTTTTATMTPDPSTPSNAFEDISAQTSRLSDLSLSDSTSGPSTSTRTTPPPQSSTMTPSSSTSTSTTPLTPSTSVLQLTSGEMTKRQRRLRMIMDIRVEGLKMSILVEDKAGRGDGKLKLEGIVSKLEAG